MADTLEIINRDTSCTRYKHRFLIYYFVSLKWRKPEKLQRNLIVIYMSLSLVVKYWAFTTMLWIFFKISAY